MSKGYVYVLTNPAMPGLVKIGKTVRSVEGRASELYQTGVPVPFEVYASVLTPDCDALERAMHESFAAFRVSNGREFFQVEPNVAFRRLDDLHLEMVNEWLADFIPDWVAADPDLIVSVERIDAASVALNSHVYEAVEALSEITPEELAPIIHRWRNQRNRSAEGRRADLIMIECGA